MLRPLKIHQERNQGNDELDIREAGCCVLLFTGLIFQTALVKFVGLCSLLVFSILFYKLGC